MTVIYVSSLKTASYKMYLQYDYCDYHMFGEEIKCSLVNSSLQTEQARQYSIRKVPLKTQKDVGIFLIEY